MAVTKKRLSITVDCDLYNEAKLKYGKISPRINELLAIDLYGSSEKDQLVQELHELKIRERTVTKRLCELEKEEVKLNMHNVARDKVLSWVSDVYSRTGVIGLNLLKGECERHGVDFDEMVRYLEAEDIATIKFA